MQLQLGDYPFFVTETTADSDPIESEAEPFSYSAIIRTDEDSRWVIAMCNDIPCDDCLLASDCHNGKDRNKALSAYIKEHCPELLI